VVKLRSWSEASLATFQELNQPWGLGFSLHNLAIAAYQEGDLERARSLCEESAAIFRRLGVRGGLTEVLVSLGAVLRATGEPAAAIAALSEALQGASTVGPRWLVAASLEGLAGVAAEFGQSAHAARLAGAAATLRAAIGVPVRPNWRRDLEQAMTTARATLGDEAFAAAWTAGQELPLDEVVADATALTTDQFAASIRPESTSASAFGLSPREVDVLRLLVAGCSDRDIAERLFISPRTASKHVGAILAKLDVSSRAEAAVQAVRDHLV
jgi:DNA-binding CsgD family transcriptional regulator